MKKVFFYLLLILGIGACENQPLEFDDFDYKSVYFPIQLPVRTLSLGEDRIDNTLDKEYKFDIGVSIGGMYENKWNWTVDYTLDAALTDSVYQNAVPNYAPIYKVLPLPASYYTIAPQNSVTIPSGSYNGLVRVELNSSFFDDTISLTGRYVIPLRITDTSADTILLGKPAITNADERIRSNWESNKSPKDWVMYGIKYVNAYHGTYLHRGVDYIDSTASGVHADTIRFRNRYVEKDALIVLTSVARNKVMTNGVGNLYGTNSMELTFANDKGESGSITITPRFGSPIVVTGSGQYNEKTTSEESWTGLKWQSMYLSYSYDNAGLTHNVRDTLVFRDRGIKWQENSIIVRPVP